HRVEEVRQADAVGLGDEAEKGAIAVEAPGPPGLDKLKARLVVAEENLVGHASVGAAVDEGEGVGSVPLDADDGDGGVGKDATDGGVRLEIFELQWWHVLNKCLSRTWRRSDRRNGCGGAPTGASLVTDSIQRSAGRRKEGTGQKP